MYEYNYQIIKLFLPVICTPLSAGERSPHLGKVNLGAQLGHIVLRNHILAHLQKVVRYKKLPANSDENTQKTYVKYGVPCTYFF